MFKFLGTLVGGIFLIAWVSNGSVNPGLALQTIGRFFAGGMNAVFNNGKTEININMPEQRPPQEGGYQP